MYFSLFGYWSCAGGRGSPKALVDNVLLQIFALGSSKIEVRNLFFFTLWPLTMTN